MNLSSKCSQLIKLVCNTTTLHSTRNLRIYSSRNPINLIDGSRRYDRRLKLNPYLQNNWRSQSESTSWSHFVTTSRSTSTQKSQQQQSGSSTNKDDDAKSVSTYEDQFANLGLFARFKKMYKEYWYVLVPVHLATSAVWFGTFYYASKSGMDIVALMQSWNFNETLIKPFRDSSLGHVAIAYLLYKIATPARYTVTLGATTVTIKHLVRLGYIKPVPSRAELVQMYQDKKESVQIKVADKKAELMEKSEAMKEEFDSKKQLIKEEFETKKIQMQEEFDTKKQQIMEDYESFKEEFKDSMKTVGTVSNPKPPPIPDETLESNAQTKIHEHEDKPHKKSSDVKKEK